MTAPPDGSAARSDHFSTIEVARMLNMAVRSVQLMVDRGDLQAWKTPGGHRRIARSSVESWLAARQLPAGGPGGHAVPSTPVVPAPAAAVPAGTASVGPGSASDAPCVLLIEDSRHYQTLVSLLMRERFPRVQLELADDGIAGLAMAGRLQPAVLIVDILLPGIDGATLIMSLRSHPQFAASRLIVITSLDEAQREPYRFALEGVPVVHKTDLVTALPPLLERCLAGTGVVAR